MDAQPDHTATDHTASDPAAIALDEMRWVLRRQQVLADGALAQLERHDWHVLIDPDANSIAVIVRHVAGNMRSRWTDFLTSDGEKEDRDRNGEFALRDDAPEDLRRAWDDAWRVTLAAVDALAPADLARIVTIRGEPHTVARAIARQIDHYGQHVGQIVLLAKHLRGAAWRTLSLPTPPRAAPRAAPHE
ncbi:MAG: DUF1572 family protein [Trueperaceae bacterium]|nr:DUF1572 family protein [Trueperaceae bacterium]